METACQHYPAGIVPEESDILAFGSNTALADGTEDSVRKCASFAPQLEFIYLVRARVFRLGTNLLY